MHVVDKKKRDIHVWLKIKNTFEVKVTITFFGVKIHLDPNICL